MDITTIIAILGGAFAGLTGVCTTVAWILDKFDKSLEKIRREIITSNDNLKKDIQADFQLTCHRDYMQIDERIARNRQEIALLKEELKSETNLQYNVQRSIFQKIKHLEKEIEKLS
jgi:uncharacterized small protein (DUF1192 family)